MKKALFIIVFIIACRVSGAQILIGYSATEIRDFMTENRKEMSLNKVKNDSFKYLKYSDATDSETMLFFLDNDSVCKGIRIICEKSKSMIRNKEFDKSFRKTAENRWIHELHGKIINIRLEEDEWSAVINIQPE